MFDGVQATGTEKDQFDENFLGDEADQEPAEFPVDALFLVMRDVVAEVSRIHVEYGHFEEYVDWLNSKWKP